jgi:hypothetical protein
MQPTHIQVVYQLDVALLIDKDVLHADHTCDVVSKMVMQTRALFLVLCQKSTQSDHVHTLQEKPSIDTLPMRNQAVVPPSVPAACIPEHDGHTG